MVKHECIHLAFIQYMLAQICLEKTTVVVKKIHMLVTAVTEMSDTKQEKIRFHRTPFTTPHLPNSSDEDLRPQRGMSCRQSYLSITRINKLNKRTQSAF